MTAELPVLRVRMGPRRVLATAVLGAILLAALLAPGLARHDPRDAVEGEEYRAPSAQHPFGTDSLGRDVFSRVLYGGRQTLGMALLAAGVSLLPGTLAGLVAGYFGRWIDTLIVLLLNALLAFPSLLLALALVALLGQGPAAIALAVGAAGIAPFAQVTRTAVLEARTREYVDAARALGAHPAGILARHILPTILPPLLAFAGVTFSWALLNAAALAFLGYAGDISAPDWGVMLAEGRQAFRLAPWVAVAPGLALSLTVFAVNLLAGSLGRAGE